MAAKQYIDAQQLLDDSFNLGLQILESGYAPSFILAIWRGGTPVGIAVQELLEYFGLSTNHIAIRTSLYQGIGKRAGQVQVHGLHYVVNNVSANDELLIVDDVHDTGLSIQQVIADLKTECGKNAPQIRIATPYYKPNNNKTGKVPDYYLHKTDNWLVFPHELAGMSAKELLDNKPGIETLKSVLSKKIKSE